jgi:hypothetical protein
MFITAQPRLVRVLEPGNLTERLLARGLGTALVEAHDRDIKGVRFDHWDTP